MQVEINGNYYKVIIERKRANKHTYLRVHSDLSIYVTTSFFTTDNQIQKIILENNDSLLRMLSRELKHQEDKEYFYYLGKKYDIVYTDTKQIILGSVKVFLSKEFDLDKWYKKQAKVLFLERLNTIYQQFSPKVSYPSLRIRKMTSRWGVCNTKDKIITLNLELIKKDIKYLDYVIVHELSHLVHANHSKDFWSVVEANCNNYKRIRKEMRED